MISDDREWRDVDGDADGASDLVVGNLSSRDVSIHLGTGRGGFAVGLGTALPMRSSNCFREGHK